MRSSSCLRFLATARGCSRPADHGHVALLHDRLDLVGRQPVIGSTIRHRLDEVPASLRSVVFQLAVVRRFMAVQPYRIWMRSLFARAFSSSCRRASRKPFTSSDVSRYVVFHDVCRLDDPLLLDHWRRRRSTFPDPSLLGLLLLGQLRRNSSMRPTATSNSLRPRPRPG